MSEYQLEQIYACGTCVLVRESTCIQLRYSLDTFIRYSYLPTFKSQKPSLEALEVLSNYLLVPGPQRRGESTSSSFAAWVPVRGYS